VQIHEFLKFLSKKAAAAAPLQPQRQRQRRYGHLCDYDIPVFFAIPIFCVTKPLIFAVWSTPYVTS
jgi:hypothetical protein